MEVLEGQNILVTISGKKNKIRIYYLSWLKTKILKTEGVSMLVLLSSIRVAVITALFLLHLSYSWIQTLTWFHWLSCFFNHSFR